VHFADAGGASGRIEYQHSNDSMQFRTNASERMRIDANGNLLVGTTDADTQNNNAGSSADNGLVYNIGSGGYFNVARYNGTVGYFNRTGTDGSIVQFRKDGTTVGIIGTQAGRLVIGSGDTGLRMAADVNNIVPWNTTTNLLSDAAIDLGGTTQRFKDLYLSGGVYLGGTGAANKLDDYEEGTFTPVVADAQDIGNTATGTFTGSYTKIGRLVIAEISLININTSGMTGTNDLYIRNFPFTNSSTSQGIVSFNSVTNSGAVTAYMTNSTAAFRLAEQLNNASRDMITVNQISSGTSDILVTLIYRT
jgi:hypothetical protein